MSLRSSYRLVILHLLKCQFQSEKRTASWEITIGREQQHIEDIEEDNHTLREEARSFVEEVYPKARRSAAREAKLPLSTFPPECPYTLDQLRDDDWMPA